MCVCEDILLTREGTRAKIADVGLAAVVSQRYVSLAGELHPPSPGLSPFLSLISFSLEGARESIELPPATHAEAAPRSLVLSLPRPPTQKTPTHPPGLRGAFAWAAPEVLLGAARVSEKADIYSLGGCPLLGPKGPPPTHPPASPPARG